MATLVLSAAGAWAGSALGGTVLGLSSAVVGRAIGATLGRAIDARLLGAGAEPVEVGRIERFRLTGASEGSAIADVWGRMRIGGQVIWASEFKERRSKSGGGGKGAPSQPEVVSYSYSVSLAVALCRGEILRVGRIWADGMEIAREDVTLRVYTGRADQMPDPLIEAVEGAGAVPAYRDLAYVVIEDLALGQFGNRVPQFSFEVVRPVPETVTPKGAESLSQLVRGVCLIPGTGEYALATSKVHYRGFLGDNRAANVNSPSGESDFATSLAALEEELPACGAVSLVVSWFGDDLRCGACRVRPLVEQRARDGDSMPWSVSGLMRLEADEVPKDDSGAPVYGGTPCDASVIEAIRALRAAGREVMFYPFVLMTQMAGNTLPDPWSGGTGQPVLPWRGRITTERAPGVAGTTDGTNAAAQEVAAFFGAGAAGDTVPLGDSVGWSGPDSWGYRRFILHYARLCAQAGGVDAFCIGSELRGLTRVRDAAGFPAVDALRALLAEVRAILGPGCALSYAADWTEYGGYVPPGAGDDLRFPLDALWGDENIDFIGIDNYAPLADWREGADHLDAQAGWQAVHDVAYLQANIEGGEGYDWFYPNDSARVAQRRVPITDGAYGEPWVYRVKDLRGWWQAAHHERLGGVRQAQATAWVPGSKPIRFTEYGCAAIDKGANAPNRFLDPKSAESGLPPFSDRRRDDAMQAQYLRAMAGYWSDPARNPVSDIYGGPMVDMARAHVWAWDARPHPWFPNQTDLWSDGVNYPRGHWLNGRTGGAALAAVVAEICTRAGLVPDVTGLWGTVRGYCTDRVEDARARLQPLVLAHGLDVIERGGQVIFRQRGQARAGVAVARGEMAVSDRLDADLDLSRAPEPEVTGRLRLSHVEADGDFATRVAEAVVPGDDAAPVSESELAMVLSAAEGRAIAERWLAEARVARDTARLALPPSRRDLGPGDLIRLEDARGSDDLWRIDRVEAAGARLIEAVRVEPQVHEPPDMIEDLPGTGAFTPALPVEAVFMDLPLLRGDEVPHAPHLAVSATPWPGTVAVHGAPADDGYALLDVVEAPSALGESVSALPAGRIGLWQWGAGLRLRMVPGADLLSASALEVLNGANVLALGAGSTGPWEVLQYREARLVEPDLWELDGLLRGQAGSDAVMPDLWPVGSRAVLLDGVPRQIPLAEDARGLARHYRIGPAARGIEDASYSHMQLAFDGVGLRPYRPCHLRAVWAGDRLDLTWVRRTREGGDSWASYEVPLGEARELYLIRVRDGTGAVRREVTQSVPEWSYSAGQRAADGVALPCTIEVAQLSDRFGTGPFERIEING